MKKLLSLLLLLLLVGCDEVVTYSDAKNDPFIKTNYKAVDALIASANSNGKLQPGSILLVATVVNVDKLNESSSLGRILAEQERARLTQAGYSVVETELRGNLLVKKDTGELLLSRELKDISKSYDAQAVVVGTYAVGSKYIYVNLKIIGNDNVALGAYDYALPLNRNVWTMAKSRGATVEPVQGNVPPGFQQ